MAPRSKFCGCSYVIVVDLQQGVNIKSKRRSATQCSLVDPGLVPAGGREQTTPVNKSVPDRKSWRYGVYVFSLYFF